MAKHLKWLVLMGGMTGLNACGGEPGTSSTGDDENVVESNDLLTIPEGSLYNAKISASGKCAVVENSSQADGARVIQLPCSQAGANGRWDIVSIGGDVYQLRASHSGKCLNVSGASTADGAKLIQWHCEAHDNERFHVQP